MCGDGRGLARDSDLCVLCIIVSNNVLDLNCNCSLSLVVFVYFVLFCGVEFATFGHVV